jgi:hypothetical protein
VCISGCAVGGGAIAQPLSKGAWLQHILVCAAVRMCISIENYRKVYKHTYSVGEIGSLRDTNMKQCIHIS